jgi:hypothetical protein
MSGSSYHERFFVFPLMIQSMDILSRRRVVLGPRGFSNTRAREAIPVARGRRGGPGSNRNATALHMQFICIAEKYSDFTVGTGKQFHAIAPPFRVKHRVPARRGR